MSWARCHVNVCFVQNAEIFAYIFKYIFKNPGETENVSIRLANVAAPAPAANGARNEIQDYVKGRYASATYAFWKLFGFLFVSKSISVGRISIHLEDRVHSYKSNGVNYVRTSEAPITDMDVYMNRPNIYINMRICEFYTRFIRSTKHSLSSPSNVDANFIVILPAHGTLPLRYVIIHPRAASRNHIVRLLPVPCGFFLSFFIF